MPATVFEIECAQGIAILNKDSCVFCTLTAEGAKRKRTVFLADIISVELCGCELSAGTACGRFDFSFDSEYDASRFEAALISRVSEKKNVAGTEEKMRIGEDAFAAALFGDEIYEEPKNSAESPSDFLARLYEAEVDEIISVLQNGRDKFTAEELERIEAALVMKMEM